MKSVQSLGFVVGTIAVAGALAAGCGSQPGDARSELASGKVATASAAAPEIVGTYAKYIGTGDPKTGKLTLTWVPGAEIDGMAEKGYAQASAATIYFDQKDSVWNGTGSVMGDYYGTFGCPAQPTVDTGSGTLSPSGGNLCGAVAVQDIGTQAATDVTVVITAVGGSGVRVILDDISGHTANGGTGGTDSMSPSLQGDFSASLGGWFYNILPAGTGSTPSSGVGDSVVKNWIFEDPEAVPLSFDVAVWITYSRYSSSYNATSNQLYSVVATSPDPGGSFDPYNACTFSSNTRGLDNKAATGPGANALAPLPFRFGIYQAESAAYPATAESDQLTICPSGFASITPTTGCSSSHSPLPASGRSEVADALFPVWTTLSNRYDGTFPSGYPAPYSGSTSIPDYSGVCYATEGSAPNRKFVVTWQDYYNFADDKGDPLYAKPGATSSLTFSIILHEATDVFDFAYALPVFDAALPSVSQSNDIGNDITIGMQSDDTGLSALPAIEILNNGNSGYPGIGIIGLPDPGSSASSYPYIITFTPQITDPT